MTSTERRLSENVRVRLASMPAAALDCVHLWQLDVGSSECTDQSRFGTLDSSERVRAAGFRLDRDRRTFSVARTTLRALLGAYLARPPRTVTIGRGAYGKPHLVPCENASELEFSVAHSGGRILYAVTRARAVGVDVERVRHLANLSSVARTILTPDECASWSGLSERERVSSLYLAWVRKEAVLKGLGCGLAMRPSRIEVTLALAARSALVLRAEGETRRSWRLFGVNQQGGWVAAIALEGVSDATVVVARLDGEMTTKSLPVAAPRAPFLPGAPPIEQSVAPCYRPSGSSRASLPHPECGLPSAPL